MDILRAGLYRFIQDFKFSDRLTIKAGTSVRIMGMDISYDHRISAVHLEDIGWTYPQLPVQELPSDDWKNLTPLAKNKLINFSAL